MSDGPGEPVEERLARLEERVAAISRYIGIGEPAQAPPPLAWTVAPPPPAPPPQPPPRPAPASRTPAKLDAEGLFGGRILLAVGAITLLLGIGFFIKYAFDNGWIGPTGRVAIGLLAGIAAVGLGERFHRTDKTVYAGAMTGLGGAILYLSLWGAGNGFHLVPVGVSFGVMAIVTAALTTLSVRRDSEVTAAFAVLGGFITPLLNSTSTPQIFNLLAYLALLDAALAFLPISRRWPRIRGASFVFTQAYVFLAIDATYPAPPLSTVLLFATLYLVLFLVQPVRKALKGLALSWHELLLVASAAAAYYLALHLELFDEHRYWLAFAVVVLAATFILVARAARSEDRAVFAAIALALITGGVAITFTGAVVGMLWGIEGALLSWVGLTRRQQTVRGFGFGALALGALTPLVFSPAPGALFVNERFATFAILAASFFAARYAYSRASATADYEKYLYLATEPLGHVFALYAVSFELYDLTHGNELSLTLFWLVYAAALFATGALRRAAFTRWEAFALLSFALLKAFVIDLSEVNPGIRIVSFLALGSVLLAISYASQRYAQKSG